jgi:protein TonB
MVRTFPHGSETGLNPARIAGISVAILVHVGAFLLLLIPATLPPQVQHLKVPQAELEIIQKKKPPIETPIETAKPVPPPTVARTPAKPQVPVAPKTPILVDAPSELPMTVEASTPIEPGPATDNPSISTAPTGPIAASHLAYVRAPAPAYPRAAIMDRAEGTVMLRVLVDVDGSPLEVTIETSSGNRELDRAARAQVLKNWKFQPAMQDGHAVQAFGRVPVSFSLR